MKRIMFVMSLILIISLATVVIAAGVNGDYNGNPIANVVINGVKLVFPDVPAIGYNGRTMMPLRACVESLNGIVEWDNKTQTATVTKPETSIVFLTLNDDGNIENIYSAIPNLSAGQKFYSMVYFGGILKGTYNIKCEILNQSGTVIRYTTDDISIDIEKDYGIVEIPIEWDSIELAPEIYTFKVSMKDNAGVYKTIATTKMNYK